VTADRLICWTVWFTVFFTGEGKLRRAEMMNMMTVVWRRQRPTLITCCGHWSIAWWSVNQKTLNWYTAPPLYCQSSTTLHQF